jgi:hypothetical protein
VAAPVKLAVALVLGAAALAATSLPPRPARADAAEVARRLAAAEDLFDEQEYGKVVQVLRPVLGDPAATRAQRLRALERTALAQLILGDEAAARVTFERLLDIDPGYQLGDRSGSPRIRRFFDEVKRQVVPDFDADLVAVLDHAAPPAVTAGRKVELDVRAVSGATHVKEVVLHLRPRGEQDYHAVAGAFRGDARWRVRFTPEASRDRYVVEYYLEGRGLTGQPVARVGSPEAPLAIEVGPGSATAAPVWYRRWYVWAGAGAVVAGVTGAILLGSSGVDDGTLGRVVVTP